MNGAPRPRPAADAELSPAADLPRRRPPDHVPVAVVGAGPVGATAANLLGLYNVETLVLDREPGVVDYPRAIGIDDETLRTFQTIDLVDEILRDAIQNVPLKFFDAKGYCLAEMQPTGRENGWYKRNIFMQPTAELALRRGLERFPHVHQLWSTELRRVSQDRHGVTLHLVDEHGEPRTIRADYVIAADGGRSPVRSQLGIPLEGSTHARKWVVIDCADDPLDAPYTALHCDPRRPYVCARMPHGHRRWEFMLFPGEDGDEVLDPSRIARLLRHHVDDPGAVEIIRARVYTHHSRIAARFLQGRVALVGDAAHLMPPWAGQGMNTGIRDVTNLCWKLAAVVTGEADPLLLTTYDQERRPHAQAMIDLSTTFGRIVSPTLLPSAWTRDRVLRAVSRAPAVKRWTMEMRFKPTPYYSEGFVAPERARPRTRSEGRMFIQPAIEAPGGVRQRLDDLLGPWFAVIGFDVDPLTRLDDRQLSALARLRPHVIKIVPSRAGERCRRDPCVMRSTTVVEDVDNELRSWFQARDGTVAVIRPDRYVAALTTPDGLGGRLAVLADQFVGRLRAEG
ncbi:MAG TPA: bifunctional 3-(3-hydroxy-phenyl)propionate/3-hydroxycinnamic acid hydroxylase [Kineosporiaceae bacterium]